jgi:hypothetical protein
MGYLYGFMLDHSEVEGVREIEQNHMIHGYGITTKARIEAIKFTEGGVVTGTRQPPRPFFGFSALSYVELVRASDNEFLKMHI